MTEKPILFKSEMVRAVLADEKTQTRRVLTLRNCNIDGHGFSMPYRKDGATWDDFDFAEAWTDKGPSPAGNQGPYLHAPLPKIGSTHRLYPKWQPGDQLWVRETWSAYSWDWMEGWMDLRYADGTYSNPIPVPYNAWLRNFDQSNRPDCDDDGIWRKRPSIHMPRWASRIQLEVLSVKVERVQEITEPEAVAEGIPAFKPEGWKGKSTIPRMQFAYLWDSINGKPRKDGTDISWSANPWVWVVEFRRIKQ